MQREHFIQLTTRPFAADERITKQLQHVIEQFPYFQTARILYLKAIYDQKSLHYDSQLKITSAYAGDRKKLYRFIQQEANHLQAHSTEPEPAVIIQQEQRSTINPDSDAVYLNEESSENMQANENNPAPDILQNNNIQYADAEEDMEEISSLETKEIFIQNAAEEGEIKIQEFESNTPEVSSEELLSDHPALSAAEIIAQRLKELEAQEPVSIEEDLSPVDIELTDENKTGESFFAEEKLLIEVKQEIRIAAGSGEEEKPGFTPQENSAGNDLVKINESSHQANDLLTGTEKNEEQPSDIQEISTSDEYLNTRQKKQADNLNDDVLPVEENLLPEIKLEVEEIKLLRDLSLSPFIAAGKTKEIKKTPSVVQESIPDLHAEPVRNGKFTFIEWLNLQKMPGIKPGEMPSSEKNARPSGTVLHDHAAPPHRPETAEIINRFIQTEPRIEPGKTKFYSPANMAKNSLVEHADTVSETLAKIYAAQGNIQKAIQSYQTLILIYPEKTQYFKALIEKLKIDHPKA